MKMFKLKCDLLLEIAIQRDLTIVSEIY